MSQPLNILWVSFEDCYPRFGCYGDPVANTPNLDKLASDGGLWTNAFSTAPVCSPARSGVITGMYPVSIGTHHHRTNSGDNYKGLGFSYEAVIPHYVKCFSEYMRAAGYYCSNNDKTDYQFQPPITAWDDCSVNGHWRNRPSNEQPFFSVFNLTKTHESQMWADQWPDMEFDLDQIEVPPYFPDTKKVREAFARNYLNIEFNDHRLGQILQELADDGLADKTAVFIWTDHGPEPRAKRWLYDAGVRSPLIIRWPGELAPGTVSDQLISTIDLAPTVMSMCGVEVPYHIQGQAFLGPEVEEPRDYVYLARDRFDEMYDTVRAVRDKRFKYMRHYDPSQPYLLYNGYRNKHPIMQEMWQKHITDELVGPQTQMLQTKRPAEELYDTQSDPHELNNLAKDRAYRPELKRLRAALDGWQRDVGDLGMIPEDVMVGQMIPNGEQPTTKPPLLVTLGDGHLGDVDSPEGGKFIGPIMLQMQSCTQGASIAYTFDEGDDLHWHLYHKPIFLPAGQTHLRAQAIRIGYKPSEVVSAIFTVT